ARRLVVCVGDGNTYGLNAGGNQNTYPAALERELARLSGGEDWIVFNAGLPGYTTHETLELIKLRLLKLRPDVILSMSLANDFEQVIQYLDGQLDYDFYPLRMAPLSATTLNDLLMRSVLFGRFAQRRRARIPDDKGGRWPMTAYGEATERGSKLYLDNIALAASLCARSGVALMLVDQPIHYSACSYGATKIASVERLRAEVQRAADAMGVPVLAAHGRFDWEGVEARGDLLLSSNETALGRVGYEKLAAVLAPQVLAAHAAWSSRAAAPMDRP
ncbi:MAG TPA: SGNH/GDSL hydrolase family protein, partial [Vicinamibacteria bacterium]|nr:SGNH/GDSL hydrolase family protein [Vicinamibacteria bacterium]